MRRFITLWSLVVALLGAAVLTQTQAQTDFHSPAGLSYEPQSLSGTFTDISGMAGTVQVNPLGANVAMKGQVFGPTTAGGTDAPKSTTITSGSAAVNCFPIGFDFPFLGKTMKYFAISSGGGVFFSETGSRAVPCPYNPTGDAAVYGLMAIPWSKAMQQTDNGGLFVKRYGIGYGASGAQNNVKTPASKSTACYRVDGAAPNRVLTVQHDYCIVRPQYQANNLSQKPNLSTATQTTAEWVFQFKFYEKDGSFELVVGNLDQTGNQSTASSSVVDYKLALGMQGDNDATLFDINHLYLQPNNAMVTGMSVNATDNWQTLTTSVYNYSTGPGLYSANTPASGRTIRWSARCKSNELPALGEDAFVINVAYPTTTSAKVQVQYDMTKFATREDLEEAGTIVGVLSDSEEPDFTLQNGTLYLKGHTFPAQNGKAAPTVVFNQMYFVVSTSEAAYPSGYKNSTMSNTATSLYRIETTVEDMAPGTSRYIHLYHMSCICGAVYSPLCHTIEISNKFRTVAPDLLETVSCPTKNALKLKVKPHEGDDVMVVKTHDLNKVKSIPDQGPLAAGAAIAEDLVVIGTYSEETTFEVTGLPDDEICYFVAVPVNKETNQYDNTHTLSRRARVAHSGVPFNLDFRDEANGNPYHWVDRTTQQENYYKDVYRPLPVGWTRTDNINPERRDLGLGLGKPNFNGLEKVSVYGQLEVQNTDADAISTPIYLNTAKIGVTYYMQFRVRGNESDGSLSETTPKASDQFIIEYAIGQGDTWSAWTNLKTYNSGGEALPAKKMWEGMPCYPLEALLITSNDKLGQYVRFRFRMVTGSGHAAYPKCDYGCIYIMDVYPAASCATPTNLQHNKATKTGTAIPISWSDASTGSNKATKFEISYREAYVGGDWQTVTVNTTNTTLTGLNPSTPYAIRVTAVCPSDPSLASDSAVFSTLYGYPYKETMVEDTGYNYLVSGFPAYARGRGPLEREVTSYTGTLPNSGNASLTVAEDPLSGDEVWATKWGWEKWLLNRKCPQSMGVSQSAQNTWLVTPVIENTTPANAQGAQVVRFRANAGWRTVAKDDEASSEDRSLSAQYWTKGAVNPTYRSCQLQVLLSNNGSFTTNDVVGSFNLSSYADLIDKVLEVKIPAEKAKTGRVQVALYFRNPNRQIGSSSNPDAVTDYMFFEIQDLEYMDGVCPELEGELDIADITVEGASVSWTAADVDHYEISWGEGEDETVAVEEPTYTFTGLQDNTTYNIKVTGFCDAEGNSPTPNFLEGTFTTLEACHTPENFSVDNITHNSAEFTSTPAEQKTEYNALVKREILLTATSDGHTHSFEQTSGNTFVATNLHDNSTVKAMTRAVCANGVSEWSEPIEFTTLEDPASLPDTFDIVLAVTPEGAGTVATADGKTRYLEDEEVSMTATAATGYRFVEWRDATGKQVGTNATFKWTAIWERETPKTEPETHEITFTAVFIKQHTVTLNTDPVNPVPGTVTLKKDGQATATRTFDDNTKVTLSATAGTNHVFVKWQDAGGNLVSTEAEYEVTLTADVTYTAVFRAKEHYQLTATVTPNSEWGSVSFNPAGDNGSFLEGTKVTMTASPATNYKFVEWQDADGNTLADNPTAATREVTMDGDKTFKAVFARIQYTVTLASNPAEGGKITNLEGNEVKGAVKVNAGSQRSLTPVPNPGYLFETWVIKTASGTAESKANPYQYTATQDLEITAYFTEKDPLDITVTIQPSFSGTVTVTGEGVSNNKVPRNGNATLTPKPSEHYAFDHWVLVGGATPTDNPYILTNVVRDWTFTAVFRSLEQYTINVTTQGKGTVTSEGFMENGKAEENATITLTADANTAEHYKFTEWLKDGEHVGSDATLTFKATADLNNATYTAVFEEVDAYAVTTHRYLNDVRNTAVGTVTVTGEKNADGNYYSDSQVTLTATPAHGYKFVAWKTADGSSELSDQSTYKFTPTADVTYRAVFEENIRISATVDPTGAGTVAGAGLFDNNEQVTLTATANDDYVFVAWKDGETQLGTDLTLTFTATETKTITAQFRKMNHYSLTVDYNDAYGSVALSPARDEDNKYKEGTEVTLTASPKQYYTFTGWRDAADQPLGTDPTNPTYKVTMNANQTVKAVFTRLRYTVTAECSPTAGGTVTGSDGNTFTTSTFDAGSKRHLEAHPNPGYLFEKWTVGGTTVSGLADKPDVYEFTLEQNTTVTAVFKEKNPLDINVTVYLGETENAAVGTVAVTGEDVTGNKVTRGKNAVLTATAAEHYAFKEWQFTNNTYNDNPHTIANVTRDYTVKAVFRALANYTVTVTHSDGGTVTKDGAEVTASFTCEEGSSVTLTAVPAEGYAFTSWTMNGNAVLGAEATHTFTPTGDVTIRAVFTELSKFHVTLLRYYNGRLWTDAGTLFINDEGTREGDFTDGEEITIKAVPNKGYHFKEWRTHDDNFDLVSSNNPYSFAVTAKTEYWAVFEANVRIDVAITPEGENPGTVTINGEAKATGMFDAGDGVTLVATANTAYKFVAWKDADGSELGTNATLTFKAAASKSITAVFEAKAHYDLHVDVTDGGAVSRTPAPNADNGQKYLEGTEVTLTATPDQYYEFVEWRDANDQPLPTDPDNPTVYKVTMNGDKTGKAVFARIHYTVTAECNPTAGGTVSGSDGHTFTTGTFEAGTKRHLEAHPNPGYLFDKWTIGGTTVTGLADKPEVYEFTLEQNTTVTAVFKEKNPLDINITVQLGETPNAAVGAVKINDAAVTVDATTAKGTAQVNRNTETSLTAEPTTGYAFVGWKRPGNNNLIEGSTYAIGAVVRDYEFTAVFRALDSYTVTVLNTAGGKVTDAEGNTVTGAQTYQEGAQVTLKAVADAHYAFTKWVIDGEDQEGAETELSFKATKNTTVQAVFTELPKYTVTVNRYVGSNATAAAGTITVSGDKTADNRYYSGTAITLHADAAKGYTFLGWQRYNGTEPVGGLVTGDHTFNITANVTYRAMFQENIRITVDVNPKDVGKVSGAGLYDAGDEVTLSVTEVDDDYLFEKWLDADGSQLGIGTTLTFNATETKTITAKFRQKDYFGISVTSLLYQGYDADENEETLGSVSITGAEPNEHGQYQEGKTLTLTATPKNQYHRFVEWRDGEGNVLADNPNNPTRTVTMDGPKAFQAVFTHYRYTVTLQSDPGKEAGTIRGTSGSETDGGTFNAGTTRKLTALPKSGYEFVKWMSGDEVLGEEGNPVLEFVLENNISVTAYFKAKERLDIDVTVLPSDVAGKVTGAGKAVVKRGENATLTATADPAYKFLYWKTAAGAEIKDNPYTLENVQRDWTFEAVFRAKNAYTINVVRVPNESAGTVTREGFLTSGANAGKAREDATVSLTATPAAGYTFKEWQDAAGNKVESTDGKLTFTATADATYRAIFEEIPTPEYTVTLVRDPEEGGRVSGDGTYEEGKEATITATPGRLYWFDGWYDAAGTKVSEGTETTYKFTVTGNVTYTAKFTKRNTVDVNVTVRLGETVDPTAGTVTGAAEYVIGETVTLTATPASDDYVFSGWRDINNDDALIVDADGNAVGSPFTFTATENVHYAAVFREEFEVKLNIDPDEHAGTVTGAGFYKETATATIAATPNPGYVFEAWLDEDGQEVSTGRTYEFTVTGNVTYTAKFASIEGEHHHTIRVNRLPNNEAGTVSGAGRYEHGAKDTLRATAAANYLFVAWLQPKAEDPTQYDTVSKVNPYVITIEGDATYVALFRSRARYNIELDVLPNDNAGDVTLTSTGATTDDNGNYVVREGRTVRLNATPADGYTFVAWRNPALAAPRDTVSRSAAYTFTATGNATYHAIFRSTPVTYTMTLHVTPTGAGTVEGAGSYRANTPVTITATPRSGYVFVGWRNLNGDMVSYDATHTFTITRNTTYTAVFRATNQVSVKLEVTPEGAGTVEGADVYAKGATVNINAKANRGYRFVEWRNEDGDPIDRKAEYTFTAEHDITYTAVFEERDLYSYNVSAEVLPDAEAGTVTGTGTFVEGTMVTLTATANDGYVFVRWQDADGNVLGAENTLAFEVDGEVFDLTYTAVFVESTKNIYTVSAKVLPNDEVGTVTGTGSYVEGESATLMAEPAEGYVFVKWQDADGNELGTDLTYTFKVVADVEYTAVFAKAMYTVTLYALPDVAAGIVMGDGKYKEGETVTITARPNRGYKFVKWQDEDGNLISLDATHTFVATADVTYLALFEESGEPIYTYYTVDLNVKPDENAGTVTGAGIYEDGTMVTITAKANEGYEFVAWMNGTDTLDKDAIHTFEIMSDVEYTALFKKVEEKTGDAFIVRANKGYLYIDNLHATEIRDVTVFNTGATKLVHVTPNSKFDITVPMRSVRFTVLIVRIVSENGVSIYKVLMN